MLKPLILKKSTLAALSLSLLGLAVTGCNSNSAGGGGGTTGAASTAAADLDTTTTVASVGEDKITRGEIFSFLEANAGEAALRQLIDVHLVMQDAKSKGIEISDADLDADVARRAEGNAALGQVIKNGGARLDSYRRQVRYQMALDQLLTHDVKADPKALAAWLAKKENQTRYDKPAQVKIGILLTSQKARADIMAEQLKKGTKTFQQLVDEQKAKKEKDVAAAGSTANTAEGRGAATGGFLPLNGLPPSVQASLKTLQVNQVTPVVAIQPAVGKNPGVLAIIQLLGRKDEVKASASDPNVVTDYKMTQVAQKIVKQSAPNMTVDQAVKQVMQSLQQKAMQSGDFSQPAPNYRQAIDYINQSQVTALLSKLRTSDKTKVSFEDKQYASLETAYKPVAAPVTSGAPASGAPASGAPASGAPASGAPASGAASGGAAAGGAAAGGAAKKGG